MKKISIIFLFTLSTLVTIAQPFKISGKVRNSLNGEPLAAAHVSIYNNQNNLLLTQGLTGKEGSFSFSGLKTDNIRIIISYIGYKLIDRQLELSDDIASELIFDMSPSPVPVGEVTVSALRKDKLLRNVSMPLAVVTEKNIDKLSAFTMADAVKNEPGLYLSRDGIWGTSLNIRGLSENRIVTLVDGNRIETSTDIAAGLAMIDVNDIERIEVIKGAASSLYGTGAMGGVINIITKEGHYSDKFSAGGTIWSSYHSVNQMMTTNTALHIGDRKWNLRLAGTFRDAENTKTPEGELLNSQFKDNNISAKFGYKPVDKHELKINYQRFFAKDVGIPGGKAFPETATATFPRELRDMFSVAYEIENPGHAVQNIKIKYFHQYILREVELKPNPNASTYPSGYHTTDGIHIQSGLIAGNQHFLTGGIDIWQRHLRTERKKLVNQPVFDNEDNIISVNKIEVGEIPIPESWHRNAGLFLQDEIRLFNDKLKMTAGGRIDLLNVKNEKVIDPLYRILNGTRIDNPPNQRLTFDEGNVSGISWSSDLGFLYNMSKNTDLTLSVSKSFRSPSLDERFKYIDLGASVLLGNPDLKPEHGYFFDMGMKIWKDHFQFSANAFMNTMNNLIVEMPGEANFPLVENPENSVTVPALINSNVDKALLYGLDMSLHYNFWNGIVFFSSFSYVRGKDTQNNINLPMIPPMNGRTGLRYNLPKWLNAELAVNMTADQNKIADGESVTKGYSRYDFVIFSNPVNFNFFHLSFIAGVENLTDRAYINHLASNRGFIKYEPGRNLFVRLKIEF